MNNEEKILTILEQMTGDIAELKQGQAKLEQGQLEIRKDVHQLQQGQKEIRKDIKQLKLEMKYAFDDVAMGDVRTENRIKKHEFEFHGVSA